MVRKVLAVAQGPRDRLEGEQLPPVSKLSQRT